MAKANIKKYSNEQYNNARKSIFIFPQRATITEFVQLFSEHMFFFTLCRSLKAVLIILKVCRGQ